MILTPARIKALAPGLYKDTKVPSLQLRKGKARTTWALYYRTQDGKERRPSLGTYPALGVDAARSAARELLQRVAAGHDPSGDWRAARAAPTVNELCNRYEREHVNVNVKAGNSRRSYQQAVKYVRAGLGARRATDITKRDVVAFLANVCARKYSTRTSRRSDGALAMASLTQSVLKNLFQFAESSDWQAIPKHSNPVAEIKQPPQRQRRRVATPDELARLAAQLDRFEPYEPRKVATLWAILLTGARVSEVQNATVSELRDGNRLELRDHKTARHEPHKTVHLPPPVVRILERTPVQASGHLFWNRSLVPFWRKVRELADLKDLQLRDFRRTLTSYGLANGASLDQLGKVLGHRNVKTTAGYAWMIDSAAQETADRAADAVLAAAGKTSSQRDF